MTPAFKELVRKRQRAFATGNSIMYTKYRNKVNRVNSKLRRNYETESPKGLVEEHEMFDGSSTKI